MMVKYLDRPLLVHSKKEIFGNLKKVNGSDVSKPTDCPTCGGTGKVCRAKYERILEERTGKVGRKNPSTSRKVAERFSFTSDGFQALFRLYRVGPQNSDELASVLDRRKGADPDPSQMAARLLELREAGFVRRQRGPDGKFVSAPTIKGNQGLRHEITDVGRDYVDKMPRRRLVLKR
jgi:hypothetical protein